MKKVGKSNSIESGQGEIKNTNNVKTSKVKPIGLTQIVMPSTSKDTFNKSSKNTKKKEKMKAQRSQNKHSKYLARQSGQISFKFKRKESQLQEEVDDKLLREELRKDLAEKNQFTVRAIGKMNKNLNGSQAYEEVKRKMRNIEYTKAQSPRDVKDVEFKVVDSIRKSAWIDDRENNLVRPNSSEHSVQAWVLTDIEGDRESNIEELKVDDLDEKSDDGSAFDTDLEDEFERKSHFDQSSEEVYEKFCKKKGITPVSYIAKRLDKTEILIPHHGLGPEGAKAFAHALMQNTDVETIDISDNDLHPEGGFAFACMLHENMYITDLNLSENFLHAAAGVALSKALLVNTSVKRLSLKGNHLTDKVAVSLAETLKENRSLAELDLSYNEFGETGGFYLGTGLSLNYGLKILNLKWNSICGKGAISIANALATNESLTSLDISWNSFGYKGSLALSSSLPKNECLKHLDLTNNHIRDNAIRKMMPAFAAHPNLVAIKLGKNPIGPRGVEAVFEAVKENPKIKHIGLEDISVPIKCLALIEELQNYRDTTIITDKHTMNSVPEPQKPGLDILMDFLEEKNSLLNDLFYQFDKDSTGDISCQEFKTGLKEMGILMDSKRLDILIKELDTEKNDKIEYSKILQEPKLTRKKQRRQTLSVMNAEKRHIS